MNMAEIACFLALLTALRSHKTCNQGNKYMVMCRTILFINIRNLFHEGVRSYLHLTIKFQDYSTFFTAFNVASVTLAACRIFYLPLFNSLYTHKGP